MTGYETSSVDSLLQVISRNPSDVNAYQWLARAYERRGEWQKALLSFRQALELDPLNVEAWVQLGIIYGTLGQWINSEDAFQRACALEPSTAGAWMGYCNALLMAQKVNDAARVRDILLARFPCFGLTHSLAGNIARVMGQPDKAFDAYQRALEIDPGQTEALFNIVDLRVPKLCDPLTLQLRRVLQDSSISLGQRANASFALARICEEAQDFDEAFRFYRDGNKATKKELRRLGVAHNRDEVEVRTAQILEIFGKDTPDFLEPLELDIRMIFIVGMPRSGTTLVEQILSSHSAVCSGGELPFMHQYLFSLLQGGAPGERAIRTPDEAGRRILRKLREQYVDRLFEGDRDSAYVIDKLPSNFFALGLIRLLFPNAIFVHCIRDPMATCWSLYSTHFATQLGYTSTFDDLSHYYKLYKHLMAHWKARFGTDIFDVKYEALVYDPQVVVRDILEFCALPWEASCLNFYQNENPVYTASMQQVRNPIYASSISRWRKFERHLDSLRELLD